MKKITILSLFIVHCLLINVFSQTPTVTIHKTDNTTVTFNLSDLDSITYNSCNAQLTPRQRVINNYNNTYVAAGTFTTGWTGSVSTCTPGTISQDIQNKTLIVLNYFRNMAGLPGVTLDATENTESQAGALICNANNALMHNPPTTAKCYSASGAVALNGSYSLLSSPKIGPNSITNLVNNSSAGDAILSLRRWILYSKALIFGHGCTSSFDCLFYRGGFSPTYPANLADFICWPPQNYVPAPLVFSKWSFSIPDASASFASATVTMTDVNNAAVSLSIITSTDNGFGDNTIGWIPNGINTSSTTDVTYNVKVNNVSVGGSTKNYSYKVIIVKP